MHAKLNVGSVECEFYMIFTLAFSDNPDRADAVAIQKEREERVRRLRDYQEDERRKKLEELRQHVSYRLIMSLLLVEKLEDNIALNCRKLML